MATIDRVSTHGSFSDSCMALGKSWPSFLCQMGLDGWRFLYILSSSNRLTEYYRYLV